MRPHIQISPAEHAAGVIIVGLDDDEGDVLVGRGPVLQRGQRLVQVLGQVPVATKDAHVAALCPVLSLYARQYPELFLESIERVPDEVLHQTEAHGG
jgi:hypothetical protein